jgi:hypothetical protein
MSASLKPPSWSVDQVAAARRPSEKVIGVAR